MRFAGQEGVSATLFLFLAAVWALTTRGYFWPVWPLIGLAIPLAVHAIVVYVRRLGSDQMTRRIERLEQTRAGAVDAQEAELRRIERDLHDGAQARLVALGMSIGLAEQKLATDPESARELLAETRKGMQEALEELRDLARGIHPPVLTDRGLGAAVSTLADRNPLPVHVDVDLSERPPGCGRDRSLLRRRRSAGERDKARTRDPSEHPHLHARIATARRGR
jgi:signal transduction histidine kinase